MQKAFLKFLSPSLIRRRKFYLENFCPPKFLDMYGVYILKSKKDNTLYIGYSSNIKKRLIEHQKGRVPSTQNKRPIEMIYCELYQNKKDAMRREQFFKSGWGRNYIKKILRSTLEK